MAVAIGRRDAVRHRGHTRRRIGVVFEPLYGRSGARRDLHSTSCIVRLSAQETAIAEISWRLAPLDDPGLPEFIAQRALPNPNTARCELCDDRPRQPLSTVLIVDGPEGLPVPFLVCARCRRTLDELHVLLETAARTSREE